LERGNEEIPQTRHAAGIAHWTNEVNQWKMNQTFLIFHPQRSI
jgi:hypothetical protein